MKTYTTVQGDMWDLIAMKQLGDVKYTDVLINSNIENCDTFVFSAGVNLTIPDIDRYKDGADLPPWKRVSG